MSPAMSPAKYKPTAREIYLAVYAAAFALALRATEDADESHAEALYAAAAAVNQNGTP